MTQLDEAIARYHRLLESEKYKDLGWAEALEEEMRDAAGDLRFEYAARLRDEVKELRRELRDMR